MAIGSINGINFNDNEFKLNLSLNLIFLNKNESTIITINTLNDGQIYAIFILQIF